MEFFTNFLTHTIYNHIVLITNRKNIFNYSNIFALSYSVFMKDIYNEEEVTKY